MRWLPCTVTSVRAPCIAELACLKQICCARFQHDDRDRDVDEVPRRKNPVSIHLLAKSFHVCEMLTLSSVLAFMVLTMEDFL
jgi:hypothetical protein